MSFIKKLFSLVGCSRLSFNKEDKLYEKPESLVENANEENDLFIYPEESLSDQLSELNYIPGAWKSLCLGKRIIDRVKDSPRLARRAISKMTSPLVSMRKKEDEIYIVTLHVVHSTGWC